MKKIIYRGQKIWEEYKKKLEDKSIKKDETNSKQLNLFNEKQRDNSIKEKQK